ncbi:alpha/beta fold hydrolase [Rhizorhabdus dicambivorans]|uniref:Alpha/beta hydrolase n=1 Tax=Rhizorhabdus dicambivorans TaxID=1850238 RepID=A0A2A4FUI1_9SPHN|nr:alpha/beta hydrolase [Rhizorhabdus dicambivorans]ATE65493.1 alpha/beta hydrolase [Rhizorhabdus dicambivorans]PCE41837.1 alpha/beta hydrolase [Rhizorhabdus dicambivorans]
MPTFDSGALKLNYEAGGKGTPVVMLHGFGMSARTCWIEKGWFDLFEARGLRAVALDSRGHGLSDKPLEPSAYAAEQMTADVLNLLDHLDIGRAHFIGHSMGARTAFDIARKHPGRMASLVTVSVGANLFAHVQSSLFIKALDGSDPENVPPGLAGFAAMLLALGNELAPLVACLSSPRAVPVPSDLAAIDGPVLLATGALDPIVGDPHVVAAALPNGRAVVIPDTEHTDVLASPRLQRLAVEFLHGA